MISKYHSNRRLHNWLIYNTNDHFLEKYTPLYRGVLYDLGAGESPYKGFFLLHADKYVAVDWSDSYHDTKANITADLNEPLPIESEVADTIVSLSVLEHLCEPQRMLDEAYRILKEGGTMILQVPWQWLIHEAPYDYFRYTPNGLRHMLNKAGFSAVTVEAQSGFFTTWVLKFNYFSARLARGPLFLKWLITAVLVPFWFFGQVIAPVLDRLDRNWELESSGYFVVAKKP